MGRQHQTMQECHPCRRGKEGRHIWVCVSIFLARLPMAQSTSRDTYHLYQLSLACSRISFLQTIEFCQLSRYDCPRIFFSHTTLSFMITFDSRVWFFNYLATPSWTKRRLSPIIVSVGGFWKNQMVTKRLADPPSRKPTRILPQYHGLLPSRTCARNSSIGKAGPGSILLPGDISSCPTRSIRPYS
jgi:hypothetical protein